MSFRIFISQSSSCYPYEASAHTVKSVSPLSNIEKSVSTRPLYPLDYPTQEIKSPVKNLPPKVVRSILDWAFYFDVSSVRG